MSWRSSSVRVCRVSSASTTSASRSSARTRSVTSSRFPIGVAQTARGTTLDRLECDQPGSDQPGFRAELSELDLDVLARGRERLAQHRRPGGGQQVVEGRDPEAAADRDALRAEDVDQRADRDAEVVADLGERRMALLDEVARRPVRAEHLARDAVRGRPGAVRLDMTATRARAGARLAVG